MANTEYKPYLTHRRIAYSFGARDPAFLKWKPYWHVPDYGSRSVTDENSSLLETLNDVETKIDEEEGDQEVAT